MKKIIIALFTLTIFSCNTEQKEQANQHQNSVIQKSPAIAYNDLIVEKEIALVTTVDQLLKSFATLDSNKIEDKYNKAISKNNELLILAKQLPPFEENLDFKDAFIVFLTRFDSIIKTEYAVLVEKIKIPEGKSTEQDKIIFAETSEKADNKAQQIQSDFFAAQAKFAKQHKLNFIE